MSGMLDLMMAQDYRPDNKASLMLQGDVKKEEEAHLAEVEKRTGRVGGWGSMLSLAGGLGAMAFGGGPILAAILAASGKGLGNVVGGLYGKDPDAGKFNIAGDKRQWDNYKSGENIKIATNAAKAAALSFAAGTADTWLKGLGKGSDVIDKGFATLMEKDPLGLLRGLKFAK